MVIDAFCHIYPKKLMKALVPYLANSTHKGNYLNDFLINEKDPDRANFVDEDARIKYMDKFGIDIEAVNFQLPNFFETNLPEKDLLKMTKFANDCVAEIVKSHSGRMVGVAVIPALEGEYLDELDRVFGELDMRGCLIYTNIYGKPLDSPEFLDFSKMAKYDLPIFLHPSNWPYYPWIWNYRLALMLGWPFDTSLALSSLVFG